MDSVVNFLELASVNMYPWLPGGAYVPFIAAVTGFFYGVYRFCRSFKYLYCYYIEHGEVICWMDNHRTYMEAIVKKYKLNEHFDCFGYVGGLASCVGFAILGFIVGSIWPITVIIGILTIPNFALRHIAREKRAKAVFEQTLKGVTK